jgi:hypothetical protein
MGANEARARKRNTSGIGIGTYMYHFLSAAMR